MMMFDYAWGGFGMIAMLVWWFFGIAGLAALIHWAVEHGQGSGKDKDALEVLRERYAKGEIGREEYKEKKKDLAGK